MSCTLQMPSQVIESAERYAGSCGSTLEQLLKGFVIELAARVPVSDLPGSSVNIGSMSKEISLPPDFDETFDSLDVELTRDFYGAAV